MPNTRRELRFASFDNMGADADRLHVMGYSRCGVWDLARVCDHLTRFMRMSLTAFPARSPWYTRLIGQKIALPLILARHRLPDGRKALASLQPLQPATEPDAVAAFRAMCDAVRDYQGEFAGHPQFGHLSPEDWRQLHLIHGAHHLGFLIPKKPERKQHHQAGL